MKKGDHQEHRPVDTKSYNKNKALRKLLENPLLLGLIFVSLIITLIVSVQAAGRLSIRFSLSGSTTDSGVTYTTPNTSTPNDHLMKLLAASSRNRSADKAGYVNKPSAGLENDSSLINSSYIAKYDNSTTPEISPEYDFGEFRAECDFSHFAYDDPINYPNQPGKSPLNMFFGNTHANAYQDYNSVLNTGNSTCNGHELNRTVYWSAALFDQDGNPRKPIKIIVYYKSYTLRNNPNKPVEFPENLQLLNKIDSCIDPNLTWTEAYKQNRCTQWERHNVVNREINQSATWYCQDPASTGTLDNRLVVWNNGSHVGANRPDLDQTKIPSCPTTGSINDGVTTVLQEHIVFPYCLKDTSSLIGKDYSAQKDVVKFNNEWSWFYALCPSGNQQRIPQIEYKIQYPIYPGDDTSKWYVASDIDPNNGSTRTTRYHYYPSKNAAGEDIDGTNTKPVFKTATNGATSNGGWIGGWNRNILQQWIRDCNNVIGADCAEGVFPLPVGPNTKALAKPARSPLNPTTSTWFADNGWYSLQYNNVFKTDGQKLFQEICGKPKLFTQTTSMMKGSDITHCIKP